MQRASPCFPFLLGKRKGLDIMQKHDILINNPPELDWADCAQRGTESRAHSAMTEWLETVRWSHFGTLTFRYPNDDNRKDYTRRGYAYAESAYKGLRDLIFGTAERAGEVGVVFAVRELHESGVPHLHFLSRGKEWEKRDTELLQQKYGWTRIEQIRGQEGVAYVVKYVTKGDGTGKPPTWWFEASDEGWLRSTMAYNGLHRRE